MEQNFIKKLNFIRVEQIHSRNRMKQYHEMHYLKIIILGTEQNFIPTKQKIT